MSDGVKPSSKQKDYKNALTSFKYYVDNNVPELNKTIYKGERIYLGMGLDGNEGYACGASGSLGNKPNSFGHFSPVYKHLDLIKYLIKQIWM